MKTYQKILVMALNNYIILPMLTQELSRELNIDSAVVLLTNKPNFTSYKPLWVKSQLPSTVLLKVQCSSKFQFKKIGKIFGLETRRYIAIKANYLIYFQNFTDNKPIGHCNLQNIYAYFLHTKDQKYLLYLTNGMQSSRFYFKNQDFFTTMLQHTKCYIIQLNYKQKYSPIDFLGQGNFSKVYLSRRNEDQKLFASKFVSKIDKNGFSTHCWIQTEKKILGKLIECEYICKLEEFYEDNEDFIFILQYLVGTDLNTYLKERRNFMNLDEKIMLIRHLLQAIQYCHHEQIVHRDLKPDNIIINSKTLQPKLIDFGLSLILSQCQLADFKKCGTNGFMAPEIAALDKGDPQIYDEKCDIFSLGIIFHMILMGNNPIKGKSYQQTLTITKQCSFQLEKEKIIETYGQSCYKFLSLLLSKNPKKRPSASIALKMPFLNQQMLKDISDSTTQKQDSWNCQNQSKSPTKSLKMNCARIMCKQN